MNAFPSFVAQLCKFLKENVLLHPRQYGFQHSSSTVHALLKFCDDILENMDNSKVTGACYLDLKKAFDTVEHSILLRKLAAHGVDEKSFGWFTSYHSNRSQRTSVGNFTSTPSYVSLGVHQGSVLGPLLFLIYINDLPDILQNTKSPLFADDTVVYTTAPSADHLTVALNEDLNNVRNWLVDNRLTLNIGKSKYMLIGGNKRVKDFGNVTLRIEGKGLEKVSNYKYLEVIIGENLSWTDHAESVARKVSQRIGVLRRIKHLLPRAQRETVYNSMMLPLFDYAYIVWGDRDNKVLMKSLQILQNKVAQVILDRPNRSSSSDALATLKWESLEERRKAHRSSFVKKTLLNNVNTSNVRGNEIHTYNTRNTGNFRLPNCRTNWGKQRSSYYFFKEQNEQFEL